MAANLVSLVMQFLTPDVIGRIAAALGLDRNKVGSAISGQCRRCWRRSTTPPLNRVAHKN
jgi:hypothetical protein